MNEVRHLKHKHLSYEDRLLAKALGPPRPDLCINQVCVSRSRTYNRMFNRSTYEKCEWICGCPVANAFFCFPCLLFGGDVSDHTWTKLGVKLLQKLPLKIIIHGLSKIHVNNAMSLALLGRNNIRQQPDDSDGLSIRKHNESVDTNRYILSRIIDALKLCGKFELPLRCLDETEDSNILGVFKGLINYTSTIESVLTSKTIQNDLLDAILSVCQKKISDEINEVDYLSFRADETTDSSCKTQIVLNLRYQIKGNRHERFWGFFEVNDSRANGLAEKILEQLSELGIDKCPEKLICQIYDGASVIRGTKGDVQCLVREKYPNANSIHCYAHKGNLILQNVTSCTRSRKFFQDIQGICQFCTRSAKSMDCFIGFIKRTTGFEWKPTRWYFQRRTVSTVYEYKDSLIKWFEHIRDTEVIDKDACQAAGFVATLKDPGFLFWLTFYYKIIPHVAIFFDLMQQRNIDSVKVKDLEKQFCNAVSNVRKMYEQDEGKVSTSEPTSKRRRVDYENSANNRTTALEICDTLRNNITDRFEFSNHFCALKLFCVKNFKQYSVKFPESNFQSTVLSFPAIDSQKLRMELQVLYSRTDLRTANLCKACVCTSVRAFVDTPLGLLQLFFDNNMLHTFSECIAILKIIVTIPTTTAESERCCSTLKRIKPFLRNTMGSEKLTALAMLSLEKRMINSIPDFNKQVIEEFAESKRREELVYIH